MIQNILQRPLAAVAALWVAWSLGALARDLSSATEQAKALQCEIDRVNREIAELDAPQDPVEQLKSMGYIHRGDTVFFDGG